MDGKWIVEIFLAIGRFFLHPLFFLFLVSALLLGLKRVKRERQSFHVRVYDMFYELRELFIPGIYYGLIFSMITIGLGIVVPMGAIALIALISTLCLFSLHIRWLSPAYVLGMSILFILYIPEWTTGINWLDEWIRDLSEIPLASITVLLALFLIAEGLFVWKKGSRESSPQLRRSKRGKLIGLHEVNRLWMIPLFLLIPGEAISSIQWWPLFSIGGNSYGLMLVPFGIGFHQLVQSALPQQAIAQTGKSIMRLSVIVSVFAILTYWISWLAIVTAVIAIIGREFINYRQRINDDETKLYFTAKDGGIVVLGVIPKSPADRMGMKVGELITKVNGKQVSNEKQFYEALQLNRTLCKLEVRDHQGEIRIIKRALYDGEHHELGILFVQNDKDWAIEAI